jgi:hypothetical protein
MSKIQFFGTALILGMNRLRGLNAVQPRPKNQIGKAVVLEC